MEAIGAELEVMKRVPLAAGHIDAIRAIGRERVLRRRRNHGPDRRPLFFRLCSGSLRTCRRLLPAPGRCRTGRRGAGDPPWSRGSRTEKPLRLN